MKGYWAELLASYDRYQQRRHAFKEAHEKKATERAATFAERRKFLRATTFKRSIQLRTRLYPWTRIDLDQLAEVRCTTPGMLSAAIIEAVVSTWRQHEHDQFLFMRRVEEPPECDTWIGVSDTPAPSLVGLNCFEGFQTRLFGMVVLSLLEEGVPAEKLAQQVRELGELLQAKREG